MKYHTVNTVMNGVRVNEDNVGQRVEWTAALVDLETGVMHREFSASGVIEQFVDIQMGPHTWKYVVFVEAVIDGRNVVECGVPVGFFR